MNKVWLVLLFVSMIGCSKSSDKLSDGDKAEFQGFAAALGETQYAIQRASGGSALTRSTAIQPQSDIMSDKLKASCSMQWNQSAPAVGQDASVTIVAQGTLCPISGAINVSTQRKVSPSIDLKTKVENLYVVGNKDYKLLNDVTAYSIRGSFQVSINNDPNNPTVSGGGTVRGYVTSANYTSDIPFKISLVVKGSSATGTFTKVSTLSYDVSFPGKFTAHLIAKVNLAGSVPDESFSLNNQIISKDEFYGFMNSFGPGFDLSHTLY